MFLFAVIRWPEGAGKKFHHYTWTDPTGNYGAYRIKDDNADGPPALLFFDNKRHADKAIMDLSQQWPGECFCVATFDTGAIATPGPVQLVSINEKGVLPK